MLRDEPIYQQFVNDFSKELYNLPGKFSNLVFFCIGTDRITGDSFGPLVGYKLDYLFHQLNPQITIEVVGNLERPVCASNVEQEIKEFIILILILALLQLMQLYLVVKILERF